MTEIVAVGGFSSSPNQYDFLADQIAEHTGLTTRGVNFSSAMAGPEVLAEMIDGRRVIGHSGAALAVSRAMDFGALPAQLDLIGPPLPERVRRLVERGILIGFDDPTLRQEMDEKIATFSSRQELMRHPLRNFGAIPALGNFATLAFARKAHYKGAKVRVGFMNQDGLFNLSHVDPHELRQTVDSGVIVKRIEGTHTRFTLRPNEVIDGLETAAAFTPSDELAPVSFEFDKKLRARVSPLLARIATSIGR